MGVASGALSTPYMAVLGGTPTSNAAYLIALLADYGRLRQAQKYIIYKKYLLFSKVGDVRRSRREALRRVLLARASLIAFQARAVGLMLPAAVALPVSPRWIAASV